MKHPLAHRAFLCFAIILKYLNSYFKFKKINVNLASLILEEYCMFIHKLTKCVICCLLVIPDLTIV